MVFSDRQVKAAIEPYLPSVKKQQVKHRKVGGVWFGFFFLNAQQQWKGTILACIEQIKLQREKQKGGGTSFSKNYIFDCFRKKPMHCVLSHSL